MLQGSEGLLGHTGDVFASHAAVLPLQQEKGEEVL